MEGEGGADTYALLEGGGGSSTAVLTDETFSMEYISICDTMLLKFASNSEFVKPSVFPVVSWRKYRDVFVASGGVG